ncbi:hypothetical protein JOM56_004327 [Amanita muscaria]
MQEQLRDLPILISGAEALSLAKAKDLSYRLFASARDLTQLAGAIIAHCARKFSSLPPQSPSLLPSQDIEDSQPDGTFPPFPLTQVPDDFFARTPSPGIQTYLTQEISPRGAYSNYPYLSTMVADHTADHAQFLSGNLCPATPHVAESPAYDRQETSKLLGDIVLRWDRMDFFYETNEALLDSTKPMTAQKERDMSSELIRMATLSLGALSCVQASTSLESRVSGNDKILEYTRSALRRIMIAEELLDAVAEQKLNDKTMVGDEATPYSYSSGSNNSVNGPQMTLWTIQPNYLEPKQPIYHTLAVTESRIRNEASDSAVRSATLEIGMPNPTFAVPPSHTTSYINSSVKSASTPSLDLERFRQPDANEMKPAEFLQTRNELLQFLFSQAFTPHDNHEEKDAEDYSHLAYWHPSDYNGSGTDNSQISDKIGYLEDENGHIVEKKRIAHIRADLRSSFNQIFTTLPRALQNRWSQYDMEFQRTVFLYMRAKYVEFTLCEDNWKARSFVSNWYSNWMKNIKKRDRQPDAPRVKKAIIKLEEPTPKLIPFKRRADDIPGPSTGRQHAVSEASTSTHHSHEDMPPRSRARIANPLTLKPVSLTTFIDVDAEDTQTAGSEGPASPSASHSPIVNGDKFMDVDTTTLNESNDMAGAAEDTGIPLSVSFDCAQSLLTENDDTIVTKPPTASAPSGLQAKAPKRPSPAAIPPTEPQTVTTTTMTDIHTTTAVTADSSKATREDASGLREDEENKRRSQEARNGTTDEFNAAWQALSAEDKRSYEDKSTALITQESKGGGEQARDGEGKQGAVRGSRERGGDEMSGFKKFQAVFL